MNKVIFLEFMGLVFDTGGMIFEDEFEDVWRTWLDKIDRYFYKISILSTRN